MRDATGNTQHRRISCAASSGQRTTSSMREALYSTTRVRNTADATHKMQHTTGAAACSKHTRNRHHAAGIETYEMRRSESRTPRRTSRLRRAFCGVAYHGPEGLRAPKSAVAARRLHISLACVHRWPTDVNRPKCGIRTRLGAREVHARMHARWPTRFRSDHACSMRVASSSAARCTAFGCTGSTQVFRREQAEHFGPCKDLPLPCAREAPHSVLRSAAGGVAHCWVDAHAVQSMLPVGLPADVRSCASTPKHRSATCADPFGSPWLRKPNRFPLRPRRRCVHSGRAVGRRLPGEPIDRGLPPDSGSALARRLAGADPPARQGGCGGMRRDCAFSLTAVEQPTWPIVRRRPR
jgi:hypothetical protein